MGKDLCNRCLYEPLVEESVTNANEMLSGSQHNWLLFGFTLAEVLITLGIIGIVATMTIPTLISKYETLQYKNAAKKAYSNIMRVSNLIMNDNGGDMSASLPGTPNLAVLTTYYKDLYKQYMLSVADCDTTAKCSGYLWQPNTNWYRADGSPISDHEGGFYYEACILSGDGLTYRFYFFQKIVLMQEIYVVKFILI